MHLNLCVMIGRVSAKGPQLRYAENGTPACSFVLEVDELTNGRTFTTFIPCEISGKYAEETAATVEAGDVLQISGRWKYKSTVDPKTGVKVSKPVVSSWGIQQREALAQSPQSEGEIVVPEPSQEVTPVKKGRPRYPKALRQPWTPTGLVSEPSHTRAKEPVA